MVSLVIDALIAGPIGATTSMAPRKQVARQSVPHTVPTPAPRRRIEDQFPVTISPLGAAIAAAILL